LTYGRKAVSKSGAALSTQTKREDQDLTGRWVGWAKNDLTLIELNEEGLIVGGGYKYVFISSYALTPGTIEYNIASS
jgi:hypothetical protein